MNRDNAESHPSFLGAGLTCAKLVLLMAMRAGQKQELQTGSSGSADVCSTGPPRQAVGPELALPLCRPGQLLVVPVL